MYTRPKHSQFYSEKHSEFRARVLWNRNQVAMNAGVRAVANIPRYGQANMTAIRSRLGIPSVEQISEKVILSASWKNREFFRSQNNGMSGPQTRSRTNGNLPQPVQKGVYGKMVSTALISGWNRLPIDIKNEDDPQKAKNLIKNFAFSQNIWKSNTVYCIIRSIWLL